MSRTGKRFCFTYATSLIKATYNTKCTGHNPFRYLKQQCFRLRFKYGASYVLTFKYCDIYFYVKGLPIAYAVRFFPITDSYCSNYYSENHSFKTSKFILTDAIA